MIAPSDISTRTARDLPNSKKHVVPFRLAQAYRIFAKYGYDKGVAGHITVRDPIGPDCCQCVHFKLIQPELLLLLLNRAAYMIHSAVHKARPDVICTAHSHTMYAKAFSALGVPLDPITQDSCAFYNDHPLYDGFRGINHGIIVTAKSIESTIFFFILLEKCCQVQTITEQAAAAQNAAKTHKRVGSETGGWFNGIPEFQLLEHEEGKRFQYVPALKENI
ncbi:arad-like aldolase/epimerase [Suillus decipiens]|nr:arad-like aldolase/epimerase [Suillus decipiens]